MEKIQEIIVNPGLVHIKEQIFGYLDQKTLDECCQVSRDWKANLGRFAAVKFLLDFGKRKFLDGEQKEFEFETVIPGWSEALKKFQGSPEELKKIQNSLQTIGNVLLLFL